MRRFAVGILAAACAAVVLPHAAAAQCEGGPTVAGFYTRDGGYLPGHCAYTNPTTPGQLYPSGAQPVPSTNPAQGASRLPGQVAASGLLPVSSSDLGPAPSYVNTAPLQGGGVAAVAPSVGPGTPLNATNATGGTTATQQSAMAASGTSAGTADAVTATNSLLPGQAAVNANLPTTAGMADQFPQTGLPAVNGNLAVPSTLTNAAAASATTAGNLPGLGTTAGTASIANPATGTAGSATGVLPNATAASAGTTGAVNTALAAPSGATRAGTSLNQMNATISAFEAAATPRAEQTYTSQQLNTVTVSYPNK